MENQLWELLNKEYKNYPEDFGRRCKSEEIEEAQEKVKLEFHASYKNFLLKYGSATLPGFIIYGLIPLPEMGKSVNNIVKKTAFYKNFQKWPGIENWYVISDDGRGNPIGIDPQGKVWLSDHDAGFEKVKLADSFEEFLHKLLTNTLHE